MIMINIMITGGIMARGMIETMSDHNVNTFVSLSSPQMGQYGGTY
jgi:palmitoyl-protein thioesterase